MKQKIIYVSYPLVIGLTPLSEIDKLHESLEKMGFECKLKMDNALVTLKMNMKYCVINLTKKCFIDSSTAHDYKTISSEKFLHDNRGRIVSSSFGF